MEPEPGFVAGFSAIVIQGNSLTFSCCCTSFVTAGCIVHLPLAVADRAWSFHVTAPQPCPFYCAHLVNRKV